MSKDVNLKELIDEIILEVEKELDEETTSGDIAGYETPNAFAGKGDKYDKKTKEVSTQAGYEIVNESVNLTDIVKLAKAQDKGNFDTFTLTKPFNVLTKTGITKVTPIPVTSMDKGKFTRTMHFKVGQKQFVKLRGVVKYLGITESVNESKVKVEDCDKPKRKNRWLELKNDESMHTNKKLSVGMMNMRNQLKEVEKYLGWYNKLKNVNEVEAQTYFKRTVSNIGKIKERIVNIARKIQELEVSKPKQEITEADGNIKADVEKFLKKINSDRAKQWKKDKHTLPLEVVKVKYGKSYAKYIVFTRDNKPGSVWGFVSLDDNPRTGARKGALLKAASWNAPAKGSRGNILDGTARWSFYGPEYNYR